VHVREHMYGRVHTYTHVYKLAAVASLEQGGIIRSATINPNDDDAVMTLSRTSFQATSVTLRAHLLLFSRPLHSLPLSFVIHACLCLYSDFYVYLYPSPFSSSISIFDSFSHFHPPSFPLCPHIVLSNSSLVPFLSSLNFLFYHYDVLRDTKLSSFHNCLPCTIRQQFVPTIKTQTAITSITLWSNNNSKIFNILRITC